jgi:hypothetical protein
LRWFFAAIAASASDWSPRRWKYSPAILPKIPAKPPSMSADLRTGCRGHLLDAHDQRDARRAGIDRLDALMDRGRAGRAGVLHAGGAFEAQFGRGLQHQRRGEILRREAGVEMPEHDLVDVGRRDPGTGHGLPRDAHDQAFDRFAR